MTNSQKNRLSPRPPHNPSLLKPDRRPPRPLERPHVRPRANLADVANRHKRHLARRRLALQLHATSTAPAPSSARSIIRLQLSPNLLPFSPATTVTIKRDDGTLGIDPPLPQTHAMAHVLANATHDLAPAHPVRGNRAPHGPPRVPQRRALRRPGGVDSQEGRRGARPAPLRARARRQRRRGRAHVRARRRRRRRVARRHRRVP